MKLKHLSFGSSVVCVILLLVDMTFADPNAPSLPSSLPNDLVDVQYPLLDGLAPGSAEAQAQQRQAAQQLGLPVEVRTRNTGIVLRLIPAGTFTMGSPISEAGRADDEGPQHQVTLTKSFYCGKFEVTQGQWEQVCGSNPSYFQNAGPDAPVESVSWYDCQAFLMKLCQMEGVPEGTYRLLTEAEWEYACRAGTQTALYNGDLVILGERNGPALDPIAWYGGNSGVEYEGAWDSSEWPEKQYNHTRAGTHPVGGKVANAYGLHDGIGNVWEWCQDWHGEYPSGSVTDPLGPASGDWRVLRGGSWDSGGRYCRSAFRSWNAPGLGYNGLGLRLGRTILAGSRPSAESLPSDLESVADAQYVSLAGLAPGSEEAQARQAQAVQELGLPLEVKTRQTRIVLRLIPAGTFTMGSPTSEPWRSSDEGPQHQVTLTKSFYCGKFEVTQGQWQEVMGSNPSRRKSAGLDAPVEQVSWEKCQTFLTQLCQKEGVAYGTYRLLTEAEWEYACRAGTTTAYYFGDNASVPGEYNKASVLGEYAWYSQNYQETTHPVGQKKPNAFGLYDMHGNVSAWCQDWYDSGYYGVSPGTDPLGPPSGIYRVHRGSSWFDYAAISRSASRYRDTPDNRFDVVGLRLARTISSYP
ncbi:MAG: formylglycine-generating enzyme family protein [Sedimentisphaerales bacterium]|nr:formylglycine-generating enzyme family protein [Sedimentisphaerales bacterium]